MIISSLIHVATSYSIFMEKVVGIQGLDCFLWVFLSYAYLYNVDRDFHFLAE